MGNFIMWADIENSEEYKKLTPEKKQKVYEKWQHDYGIRLLPTVEEFKESTGLPTWREIVSSKEYQELTPEQKEKIKNKYRQDSGFEPELQVFRSDGNVLTELIKGITETSATAELFKPEAETIPVGTPQEVARGIGSVIGDLPMFAAGSLVATLATQNPAVTTAASFATPTAMKHILKARNTGVLTDMPKIYTKELSAVNMKEVHPLYITSPGGAFISQQEPLVTYVEKSDENAKKFFELASTGAYETGVSAITGAALAGATRFIAGAAKGNKIVDAALASQKTFKSPKELLIVSELVDNVKNTNVNSIFAKRAVERTVEALEKGDLVTAYNASITLRNLAPKIKVVEQYVVPTTVLSTVPPILHGEMPSARDVGEAAAITTLMPLATHLPAKIAKKALGIKQPNVAQEARKILQDQAAAIEKEISARQRVEMPAFSDQKAYAANTIALAEPKLYKAFATQYIKEKVEPLREKLKIYSQQEKAEVKKLIEEANAKNPDVKYTRSKIIPRARYEALPDEVKREFIPESEKLQMIKVYKDKTYSEINKSKKLRAEDNAIIAQKIDEYVYDYNNTIKVYKTHNKSLEKYVRENGIADLPAEEILKHMRDNYATLPKAMKKMKAETIERDVIAMKMTQKEYPKNISEAGVEGFRNIHGDYKRFFTRSGGQEKLKDKVVVYYATRGAKVLLDKQFVYVDAKTAQKYEPNQIIRAAKVKTRDLYHTEAKGVMTVKYSEKTMEQYIKRNTDLFEDIPFANEAKEKLDTYIDYMKTNGMKTEKLSKIFGSADLEGRIELEVASKYEKRSRSISSFAEDVLELTKEGNNPEVVAPISAGFLARLIQALRMYKVDSEFLLHGRMKQGVFFYEELGPFGRLLRDAAIEAETNGMRLAETLRTKYGHIYANLNKESREAITYAITGQDPRYAEFYQEIGYINKRDPNYKYLLEGNLDAILTPAEKLAKQETIKFYNKMLDEINLAREAVGREPIKPFGENTYTPLATRRATTASMLLNMLAKGEDVIGKTADELVSHIEEQAKNAKAAGNVTFHNVKIKTFNVVKPEMDARELMHSYINDSARYIALQPFTVYVADALKVNSINGVSFNIHTLGAGAAVAHNRIMNDMGFLQMGHRFAENMQNTKENNKLRAFAARIQNNVAGATILYNTAVIVNQLAAFRNTFAKFGPKAIYDMSINLVKLANIKELKKTMMESDILYARYHEPFREFYEGVKRVRKNIQDAGIFASKVVDLAIATATYKTAKERYLRDNPGDVKGAISYASEIVAKTQASTLLFDRAPIQRGILGIYITTFANAPLADYGFLVHDILGYHRNMDKLEKAIAITNYILATAMINTLYEEVLGMESVFPAFISRYVDLKERGFDDQYVYYSILTEALKAYPLGQGARMGGSALGPVVTHMDMIMRGSADPRYAGKAIYAAMAMLLGLPGMAQTRRIIRAAEEGGSVADFFITKKDVAYKR